MFNLLNQYSKGKIAWYLLIFSVIVFQLIALYFQHYLHLPPCTLCIYQRLALFAILFMGIIGFIGSKKTVIRNIAIIGWILGAYKGFEYAYLQARLQFEPSATDTCSLNVHYPFFLRLDEWLPYIFKDAGEPCSKKIWTFLTIEMSQWMIIIFGCYMIVGILVLLSQAIYTPPTNNSIWRN